MDGFWQHALVVSAWVTLALCSIIGLVGTLLPGIPGGGLILIGAVAFALMTGFQWLSWPSLLFLAALALVGGVGQYFVSGYGARKFGASRWGAVGALIGFFVGMLVFPPLGAIIGAFLGAVAIELVRLNVADRKQEQVAIRAGDGELIEGDDPAGEPPEADVSPDPPASLAARDEPSDDPTDLTAEVGFRDRCRAWMARAGGSKLTGQTRKATLAGIGAVLGAVGSFLFEFVFGVAMVLVIVVGLFI